MAWYEVYERDVLGKPGAARYGHKPSPVFRAAAQRLSGAQVADLWPPPATLDEIRQRRLEPPMPVYDPALILEVGEGCVPEGLQFPRQPSMRGPAQYARFEIEQRPDPLSEFTRDWTIPTVLLRTLPRDLASGLWEMACGLAGGVWDWITGGRK